MRSRRRVPGPVDRLLGDTGRTTKNGGNRQNGGRHHLEVSRVARGSRLNESGSPEEPSHGSDNACSSEQRGADDVRMRAGGWHDS